MKVLLTPPQFTKNNIKEKIICTRAHRERMFRIAPEQIDTKLIFHNYGQGGAGWTFLFGCVTESIEQFEQEIEKHRFTKKQPIAVLGAGCYGLLTAILLTHKGYNVHIIAKETTNLPSHKAAGFFFPRARRTSTEAEKAIFTKLGIYSYKTYLDILHGNHLFITDGPQLLPAYYGPTMDPGFAEYIKKGIINNPKEVTINFGNKTHQSTQYQTIFMNPARIMCELERNIKNLEIPITKMEVTNFNEVTENIIFNCAGLGAKQLTNDKKVVPVQGHLITLQNQTDLSQLQYMVNVKVPIVDEHGITRYQLLYYAPKDRGILGITFLRGRKSLLPNYEEFDKLLERCKLYFG